MEGTGAARQVMLSGSSPLNPQKLTITTSSPWVSATLVSGREAPAGSHANVSVVGVTLSRDTPVGPLQAQVIVTMPTGEKLLLPIIADVTAKR